MYPLLQTSHSFAFPIEQSRQFVTVQETHTPSTLTWKAVHPFLSAETVQFLVHLSALLILGTHCNPVSLSSWNPDLQIWHWFWLSISHRMQFVTLQLKHSPLILDS